MGVDETKRGVEMNLFISIQVIKLYKHKNQIHNVLLLFQFKDGGGGCAISTTPNPPFYGLANITRTVTNEFIQENTHKYGKKNIYSEQDLKKIIYFSWKSDMYWFVVWGAFDVPKSGSNSALFLNY